MISRQLYIFYAHKFKKIEKLFLSMVSLMILRYFARIRISKFNTQLLHIITDFFAEDFRANLRCSGRPVAQKYLYGFKWSLISQSDRCGKCVPGQIRS